LVVASCPPLQPLADDTFGATTLRLVDVAVQYRICACAAGLQEQCKTGAAPGNVKK
jgi:hypothetical protein